MASFIKRILQILLIMVIIISVLVTATVAFVLVSNYDNLGKTIATFSLIKVQSLNEISNEELIEGAVKGMVGALGDPYSTYLDKDSYDGLQDEMQGTYGGVGLLITKMEDGSLIVVSPFRGTPAHRAGIISGDEIVDISGEKTREMTLEDAANLMKGASGTDVTITTYREDRGDLEITLTREIITIPTVTGKMIDGYPGVGYIEISMFNEITIGALKETYETLLSEGMNSLVVDLRNNPGGGLFSAIEVSDFFIPQGPAVHIETKFGTETYDARSPGIDIPLVVLVNSGSASASEIVSGAIQDTGVGILVGENTFGKGLVQSVFPLMEGTALKLTTARYLTPNERDINNKGIEPDYVVVITPEDLMEALLNAPNPEKDSQLQKALEILSASGSF